MDRVLVPELNACAYGLSFLGGFTSSGIWTSTPLRPPDGSSPARTNAFCTFSICELFEVGEGALSKLLACKVYEYLGFFWVSSAAGALAPFRKSHVSSPTSAVNTQSLVHTSGDAALPHLNGFAQRVLLSKRDHQERVTHDGLSNIYYDPLLGHNDRTSLTVFALSSKVALSRCVYKKNLSSFGRQTIKPTFHCGFFLACRSSCCESRWR